MSRYFVTRHSGALAWATQQGIVFDQHLTHLTEAVQLQAGDVVAGTLPVNLAADLCARGVIYLHLSLELPESLRGQELSAEQLHACHAKLERFDIQRVAFNAED